MNFLFRRKFPETAEALIDGEIIAVTVKVSERARSYRLSLPHAGDPVLTVPSYGRWQEAAAFLDRQVPWLAERLRTQDRPVAFVAGDIVPLRGVDHVIRATGRVRGTGRDRRNRERQPCPLRSGRSRASAAAADRLVPRPKRSAISTRG